MVCKGCDKRHVGCHSTCQGYKDWKSEKDRISELARKDRKAESNFIEDKVRLLKKARRYKKKW